MAQPLGAALHQARGDIGPLAPPQRQPGELGDEDLHDSGEDADGRAARGGREDHHRPRWSARLPSITHRPPSRHDPDGDPCRRTVVPMQKVCQGAGRLRQVLDSVSNASPTQTSRITVTGRRTNSSQVGNSCRRRCAACGRSFHGGFYRFCWGVR